MEPNPVPVSIVVPTYNRRDSLLRTLNSLKTQSLSADNYQVIIVDDGSVDGTDTILEHSFPFSLCYQYQANSGDAKARNTGARVAGTEYIIFVDDDIVLHQDCLMAFLDTLRSHRQTIVVGNLQPMMPDRHNAFHRHLARVWPKDPSLPDHGEVPFTECLSGFMAIRREDYYAIGMMRGLNARGANAWCDIDFSYRAHLLGYRLYRCSRAVGYHHDGTLQDFPTLCRRCEKAGQLAVGLFRAHPDLSTMIPAFRDKGPPSFSDDPPLLLLRKISRSLLSTPQSVAALEAAIRALEKHRPDSRLLAPFYRWVLSAYTYRGYRHGLREMKKGLG